MYTDTRQFGQKRIFKGEQAVAGVIEAMLLVALFAIIMSTVQVVYIPQVMEQREAEHMDVVANQFSYFKSLIDIQALTGTMKTEVPLSYVPMLFQITLGSTEIPYFITARSYGEISTVDEGEYKIETLPPLNPPTFLSGIPLTSIKYEAYNAYFVDQTYILEGGGIILNQPTGGSVMRADPAISIKIENKTKTTMWFYLPKLIGVSGKNSTYGHGKCFVRTNYSSHETYFSNIPDGGHIRIYTKYLNAWNESLNRLVSEEIGKGYVNIFITRDPLPTIKIIPEEGKEIELKITVVSIYVQIGPGWIG